MLINIYRTLPTLFVLICISAYFYDIGRITMASKTLTQQKDGASLEHPVRHATVAVIYSGDLRGWVDFVDNNIEHLFKNIAHNCTVHVYMVPKLAQELRNPTTAARFGEGLRKIKPFLQYFMVEEADIAWDDFIIPAIGCPSPLLPLKPQFNTGYSYKFYQQFISVYRVYGEILKRERVQGWRYEWFIRSRLDIKWIEKPSFKLTTASKSKIHVPTFVIMEYKPHESLSDHFAIMHTTIAAVYLTVAHSMFQGTWCHPVESFVPYCHLKNISVNSGAPPECYLARWLADHNIPWQLHDFKFDIQSRGQHMIDY